MGRRPKPRPEVDPEMMRAINELLAHFETPEGAEELRRVQEAIAYMNKREPEERPEANPLSYVPEVPDLTPVPEAPKPPAEETVIEF